MELRPLGSTGLRVSPLGLGTVKLGRAEGVKYPRAFEIPADAQAAALLDRAADLGINLIDTAPAYGTSEERLGALLGPSRDRWVIVTKAGEEFESGRSRFDFAPAVVRASVERSLRRLRTDRVEVLLLHSDGVVEQNIPDTLAGVMEAMKREGKVRGVGISTKTCAGAVSALAWADVVMVTLNPAYDADKPAIEGARRAGVGVLVKKALASGQLSGGDAHRALAYAARHPGVSSVIVGTLSVEHLADNCRAVEDAGASGNGPAAVG